MEPTEPESDRRGPGAGAPDRRRRRRHGRAGPPAADPGHPDVRQRAAGVAGARRPAGARRHHLHDPRGVQPRRRGHGGLLDGHPGRPPGAGRGAGPRAAGAAPLAGAGRGDDQPPGDRGGRHARQDHDHVDDHGDPPARRARPVVRDRRRDLRGRVERAPRRRRPVRGRGRRERPVVPALPPARRGGHQHRRRPPEHLRRPGRAGGRVRRVRRAGGAGRVRGHLRRRPRCAPVRRPGAGGRRDRVHVRDRAGRRPAAVRRRLLGARGPVPGDARRDAARRDQPAVAGPRTSGSTRRRRRWWRCGSGCRSR